MSRNNNHIKAPCHVLKICGLGIVLLVQTACGGGTESSDAGIEDIAIGYIKRPTPRDQTGAIVTNDIRTPVTFNQGGDLYLQTRATANSPVKNITQRITNGRGDVKDVSVSYDSTKLVFSLRLQDQNPNDAVVPKWYLYEYNIPDDTITQLTSSTSNTYDGDDISPRYLPDGRIIFSSNRQSASKGIRTNEGRGSFTAVTETRNPASLTFVLHIRETDGSLKQVSFNESHDLNPMILKDSGRILFSRWNKMGARNNISLFTMNPDGTDVQMYYGAHSHRTGQNTNSDAHFTKPLELDDGRILTIFRPLTNNFGGGDIISIDGKTFADNTQPIWAYQSSLITGTAQTVIKQNVSNSTGVPLSGRYNAVYPMSDGTDRYLMSWSQCRIYSVAGDTNSSIIPCTLASASQLNDPAVTEAPPIYGIYLADAGTQVPIVKPETDTVFDEIVMAYPRKTPPIIYDKSAGDGINQADADVGVGILHIRSVYDFDDTFSMYGAASLPENTSTDIDNIINLVSEIADPTITIADQRPARFLRITKSVSLPERLSNGNRILNSAFGRSTQQGMREIIGYVPIEPDGSVKVKVPANVPLTIGILDKDGRRISNRHQYWFQIKPGETLECVGCHVHDATPANLGNNKPHGGRDTKAVTFNQGAPTTGLGFPYSLNTLWAEVGETMAETRARHSCLDTGNPCAAMKPSTDLIYTDVWTDDVASNRSADASFTINYSNAPVSPVSGATQAATACANANYDTSISSFTYCRIIINYEEHIQPVWEKARAGNECTACHTATGFKHLTSGQLNLDRTQSDRQNDHFTSYQELLNTDTEQFDNGGVLSDFTIIRDIVPTIDANNDGIPDQETVPDPAKLIQPSMSTAGALSSNTFMELMTGQDLNKNGVQPTDTGNLHQTLLTPSELKLISEWLDMGAQYYNNPLDPGVPSN